LNSGKKLTKKTKTILEVKTKLQSTQGKIDITKSSVKDIKNRNERVKKIRDKKEQREYGREDPLY
jgi:hypothetical protein